MSPHWAHNLRWTIICTVILLMLAASTASVSWFFGLAWAIIAVAVLGLCAGWVCATGSAYGVAGQVYAWNCWLALAGGAALGNLARLTLWVAAQI